MTSVKVATRESYQFAAEPKIVNSRAKYRPTDDTKTTNNDIMRTDPRVKKTTSSAEKSPSKRNSQFPTQRNGENTQIEEAVPENAYTQLTERGVEDDAKIVPYYYVDKPKTPQFKPLPPGVDVATQIEDTELFDFKLEVEPVLSVLVGKTLEQARLELCEEDERVEEKRHRMTFEKTRNAELMVTQRKEALHIRKQEEKARREKQHQIQDEGKAITHKRYLARLLAKNITLGMSGSSINLLADQGVLSVNLRTEIQKDFIPYLTQTILTFLKQHNVTQEFIKNTTSNLEQEYVTKHAKAVKCEFDRRQKILDDKHAEEQRLAAERKHRRERRRLLRLFCHKEALLKSISSNVVSKPQEITSALNADIVDMVSTGKEAVATIGGLLGELWLVLESMNTEKPIEIQNEQIVQILTYILNEKYKAKDLNIYADEHQQSIIQNIQEEMANDLIDFNKNKSEKIQEIANKLEGLNWFQNLRTLNNQNLLDQHLFNQINQALLYIFFASVDYKPPVVKQKSIPTEQSAVPQEQPEAQVTENSEEKPEEGQKPTGEQENIESINVQTETVEAPKEEFVMPEITPFEALVVQAKSHLKLTFLKDWEFAKDFDAIVRFRIPLNRAVEEPANQEENADENTQVEKEPTVSKTNENVMPNLEGVSKEERDEIFKELTLNSNFIEPYNGSTFEAEKGTLTEQLASPNFKIYNVDLVQGKRIAHINERSQEVLRKELITIIKEHIHDWKEVQDEAVLAKAYVKYKKNEQVILNDLISNPEEIPIFDIESN